MYEHIFTTQTRSKQFRIKTAQERIVHYIRLILTLFVLDKYKIEDHNIVLGLWLTASSFNFTTSPRHGAKEVSFGIAGRQKISNNSSGMRPGKSVNDVSSADTRRVSFIERC